jgi:predicted secreted protein
LLEIGPAIERTLKEHGIVLHPSPEMSYLSGREQKKSKSASAAGGK